MSCNNLMSYEADLLQLGQLHLAGATNGATKHPEVLNLLHIPKTGGSSIWHTIADFSAVEDPPLAYDFYHEAIKDQLPFSPAANAICFFGDSGLWSDYRDELYERHAASHARFAKAFRPTIADSCVVTHTHFPAPIGTLLEGAVTVATTRESGSRFLSHAAHCLRELRRYQDAVTDGAYAPDPLLSSFAGFPRNNSLLDFCRELAELRPGIATYQLRYILACLCSGNCRQSFEIMAKWSNQDVIEEFQQSFEILRQDMLTIRLKKNGQFSLSDEVKETMSAFGISDFQVNRSVLETVATPREIKSNPNRLRTMFRADRAFFEDLAIENALLWRLHSRGPAKDVRRFRPAEPRYFGLWR